jgi:hypothetical protein
MSPMEGIELEWFGQFAYFKASNVQATILDENGAPVSIAFQDDLNRPQNINSGGGGEEISREDQWTEGGVERRVKFYFGPRDPSQSALQHGWSMYDARMYNADGTDWVYWGGDFTNASMVQVPSSTYVFRCDYFEINYLRGFSLDEPGGKFVASNVTMGGYLSQGYDVSELSVFDPCEATFPGESCRAIDGDVFCGDYALTLEDFPPV